MRRADIVDEAMEAGLSERHAGRLIRGCETKRLIYPWNQHRFATMPQPDQSNDRTKPQSKREIVAYALEHEPSLSDREIERKYGISHSYVGRIRRDLVVTDKA